MSRPLRPQACYTSYPCDPVQVAGFAPSPTGFVINGLYLKDQAKSPHNNRDVFFLAGGGAANLGDEWEDEAQSQLV